jgi:hypothetical protein
MKWLSLICVLVLAEPVCAQSAFTITPASLPNATTQVAYSQQLGTSGGAIAPVSWSWSSQTGLPPGLNFSSGTISGTPPANGSGTFSVEAAVATLVPKNGHVLVLDNSNLPIPGVTGSLTFPPSPAWLRQQAVDQRQLSEIPTLESKNVEDDEGRWPCPNISS